SGPQTLPIGHGPAAVRLHSPSTCRAATARDAGLSSSPPTLFPTPYLTARGSDASTVASPPARRLLRMRHRAHPWAAANSQSRLSDSSSDLPEAGQEEEGDGEEIISESFLAGLCFEQNFKERGQMASQEESAGYLPLNGSGLCEHLEELRTIGKLISCSSVNLSKTTELGSKKELKSMPFITYLSGLLTAQMLSDDQLISGVEIRCEEKGRCPSTCHLCRRPGKEQLSPTPVLLEINRVVPLYTLIQDNGTKELLALSLSTSPPFHHCLFCPPLFQAFKSALMSSYWCSGKGDVIDDWCRCDLSSFDASGLPNCSPLPQPVLRLSPTVEPSSTVVSLEWVDVQPAIGTKVSDYILQHKKVDEYTDTDLYTGKCKIYGFLFC
ncbi:Astrotactin-2, partial [Galemys pyrenaicus]